MPRPSLGIQRDYQSVPTADSERAVPFHSSATWGPAGIEIFGHTISVDLPTGNLIVKANDINYKYHAASLSVTRTYDLQEQHMQLTFARAYANVHMKPHWFGNWQFGHEASIDEAWRHVRGEIHVATPLGINGIFCEHEPDFKRTLHDVDQLERRLRGYGISGALSEAAALRTKTGDMLLRTNRGAFQIICGRFRPETLVDDTDAEVWVFAPVTGTAAHISSSLFYNERTSTAYRDVGLPFFVTELTDALGHRVTLRAAARVADTRRYILADDSGRELEIELSAPIEYDDPLKIGRKVRQLAVSAIIDPTRDEAYRTLSYRYTTGGQLKEVELPSSLVSSTRVRRIRYHYDDIAHPGVLSSIENSDGARVSFFYSEDRSDSDDRLNPRLKIRSIVDPEGNELRYDYRHTKSEISSTVLLKGVADRMVRFTYIRDRSDTMQRYVTATEISVRRGFVLTSPPALNPRTVPEVVRWTTEYTEDDGRFNVSAETDPNGRVNRYKYNAFNQVDTSWDWDDRPVEYTYDLPPAPTPENPRRYDLLTTTRQNLVREVVHDGGVSIGEARKRDIIESSEYARYDDKSSRDSRDYERQSTHRTKKFTDARGKTTTIDYDDVGNHRSLRPWKITAPGFAVEIRRYNERGELSELVDAEGNVSVYTYTAQGSLRRFLGANGEVVTLDYYPCGSWLHVLTDSRSKQTTFLRRVTGELRQVTDPVGDVIEYTYYDNGRMRRIATHRTASVSDGTATSASTTESDEIQFEYLALGEMSAALCARGLKVSYEYDEAGRLTSSFFQADRAHAVRFCYDRAGQITARVNRRGGVITFGYFANGTLEQQSLPDWRGPGGSVPGKSVTFVSRDYFGRPLTITDSEVGTYEQAFSETGKLLARAHPGGSLVELSYNDDDRLVRASADSDNFALRLELDSLGRTMLLEDSTWLDGAIRWRYKYQKGDGSHQRVLRLFKRYVEGGAISSDFDYNEQGRITLVQHRGPAATIYDQIADYRDDGLLSSLSRSDSSTFRYDGIKQLRYEEAGGWTSDYDQAGNRVFRTQGDAATAPRSEYDSLNRIEVDKDHGTTYEHDDDGNVVRITGGSNEISLCFDASNRLRCITVAARSISYVYDFEGQLASREVGNGGAAVDRLSFHYLMGRPYSIRYNDAPHSVLTWDATGTLLRIRCLKAFAPTINSVFPLEDCLRYPVRSVDREGNVIGSAQFDAWGNAIRSDGTLLLTNARGAYRDDETGFLQFGARWYAPQIGRWISEDPLFTNWREPADYEVLWNAYRYCRNSPVNYLDPSGLVVADSIELAAKWASMATKNEVAAAVIKETAEAGGTAADAYELMQARSMEDVFHAIMGLALQPEAALAYELVIKPTFFDNKPATIATTGFVSDVETLSDGSILARQNPLPGSSPQQWEVYGNTPAKSWWEFWK